MQPISNQLVETLDRKYQFVISRGMETFIHDAAQFIQFIVQDLNFRGYAEKIQRDFERVHQSYTNRLENEKIKARKLYELLIKKEPKLNDDTGLTYEVTFERFRDILQEADKVNVVNMFPHPTDDTSEIGPLLNILGIKILRYESIVASGSPVGKIDESIKDSFEALQAEHIFTHREWINTVRIHPGHALGLLLEIVSRINPKPDPANQPRRKPEAGEIIKQAMDYLRHGRQYAWIQTAAYELPLRLSFSSPVEREQQLREIDANLNIVKDLISRVYEAVRYELGSTLRHYQIINRYKTRSQVYNLKFLRDLVTENTGGEIKFIRDREDALTLDLARYLYDQGLPVLYRVKMGNREIDLVDPTVDEPVFVEAKAYKEDAKAELLDGLAQTHSYLISHEASQQVTEAYYVIFRLGGPVYEFPYKISTGRFVIFPVVIDLGMSQESGRRQGITVVITEAEILSRIQSANIEPNDKGNIQEAAESIPSGTSKKKTASRKKSSRERKPLKNRTRQRSS